jgi:hypothetical protein
MKKMYLEKSILFLTDVPYVITGRGAGIFAGGIDDILINKFKVFDSRK